MKRSTIFRVLLLVGPALAANTVVRPPSVYEMPRIWPRHCQLRQEMIAAIQRGDAKSMEATCRAALEILPTDATWRYNLACALSCQKDSARALEELDKAIENGFRDADAFEKDHDLSYISKEPRFAELVKKARELRGKPVAGQPACGPVSAPAGSAITICETNIVWNFDTGVFEAIVNVGAPRRTLSEQAANYSASKPTSPERPYATSTFPTRCSAALPSSAISRAAA